MTVLVEVPYNRYPGNGTTDEFDFEFQIATASELVATVIEDATGDVDLLDDTDYELAITPSGGTLTTNEPVASGYTLDLRPIYDVLQATSIKNQGSFRPEVHERIMDRLAAYIQMVRRLARAGVRAPDNEVTTDLVLPRKAARAGMILAFDADGLPVPASGTGADSALRADIASTAATADGSRLMGYRQEAAGSVARSVFEILDTVVRVDDFGFKSSGSAADNAAACIAAIAARTGLGGIIKLPRGVFACNQFGWGPQITVKGQGMFATRLQNSQSGYFLRMGGDISPSYDAANRKIGVGLSDVSIEMSHKDGHAIQVMECVGALIERIYHEGTITSGRSNRFIRFDAGNADSFFNKARHCITLHDEVAYELVSTGAGKTTQVFLEHCTGVGDVSTSPLFPNSIGVRIAADQGSGSVILGGNMEAFGRGLKAENGCQSFTVNSLRCEGNTKDFEAEANAAAFTIIGGLYDEVNGIIDTQNRISRINGVNGSNLAAGSILHGANVLRSQVNGQVPLTIADDVGYTTDEMLVIKSSAGDTVFSISAQGKILRINNNLPVALNAACTDLPTAVALVNQIRSSLLLYGLNQ